MFIILIIVNFKTISEEIELQSKEITVFKII